MLWIKLYTCVSNFQSLQLFCSALKRLILHQSMLSDWRGVNDNRWGCYGRWGPEHGGPSVNSPGAPDPSICHSLITVPIPTTSKHEAFTQWWINVGPPSTTVAQHWTSIGYPVTPARPGDHITHARRQTQAHQSCLIKTGKKRNQNTRSICATSPWQSSILWRCHVLI